MLILSFKKRNKRPHLDYVQPCALPAHAPHYSVQVQKQGPDLLLEQNNVAPLPLNPLGALVFSLK